MKAKRKSSEVVVGLARTKELPLLIWSHPSLVIVHRFWWDQLGWGRSSALSARIWVTAPGSVFIPWKQVLVLCSAHGNQGKTQDHGAQPKAANPASRTL